jgi:hypothetical protein
MESSSILKIREYFISNIIIFLLLPLLTFFLIFISYGNELHQYLSKNPEMYYLYELSTLKKTVSQSAILLIFQVLHLIWLFTLMCCFQSG